MSDTAGAGEPGGAAKSSKRGLVIGCAVVAAVAVLVPVGCTVLLSSTGGPKTYAVSIDVASAVPFAWPLTVGEGTIYCPGEGRLVIEAGGTKYALNGLAKGAGYADIAPIWSDNPQVSGAKVDISGLVSYGGTVCGY